MTTRHQILGGKVQLYKRGRFWHCSATMGGTQHRETTKKEELTQAEDAAEDWYLELRGKFKRGDLGRLVAVNRGRTFADAAERFIREYPIMTEGQRNQQYVEGIERRLRKHIIPFMGSTPLPQVTSGFIQEYFLNRITTAKAANAAKAEKKAAKTGTVEKTEKCMRERRRRAIRCIKRGSQSVRC